VPLQITATVDGSSDVGIALQVKVITGQAASPVGVNTVGATGITPSLATGTGVSGGSWVYGALLGLAGAYTVNASTIFGADQAGAGLEFIAMRTKNPTTAGVSVTVGASSSTANSISIALTEILAGTGVLAEDPSSPAAVVAAAAKTVTTAAFFPPGGSLLVAMVSSNGAAGVATMTVSGGGLTWTEQPSLQHAAGSGYSGVWTAPVPVTAQGGLLVASHGRVIGAVLETADDVLASPGSSLVFASAATTGPAAAGFTSLSAEPSTSIPASPPYPSFVQVQGDGSLLVAGRSFASKLTCDASNIKFLGCKFVNTGDYCVFPGPDATGPWIFSYCQASAPDQTAGNATLYGFPLPDGLSSSQRSVVDHCNLFWFSAQPVIAVNHCLISNSYVHDTTEVPGNHAECLYLGTASGGASCTDVTVTGCTLLPGPSTVNTAACYMDAHGNNYDQYTITGNLVAGGDYTLYGGAFAGKTDTNLVITGNYFSTIYYSTSGAFGTDINMPPMGVTGNVWAGNRWYDGPSKGQLIGP
jgi:hypothetical protein